MHFSTIEHKQLLTVEEPTSPHKPWVNRALKLYGELTGYLRCTCSHWWAFITNLLFILLVSQCNKM